MLGGCFYIIFCIICKNPNQNVKTKKTKNPQKNHAIDRILESII